MKVDDDSTNHKAVEPVEYDKTPADASVQGHRTKKQSRQKALQQDLLLNESFETLDRQETSGKNQSSDSYQIPEELMKILCTKKSSDYVSIQRCFKSFQYSKGLFSGFNISNQQKEALDEDFTSLVDGFNKLQKENKDLSEDLSSKMSELTQTRENLIMTREELDAHVKYN